MNPQVIAQMIGGVIIGIVMIVVVMGFGGAFYKAGAAPEETAYAVEMDPSLAVVKASLDAAADAAPVEEIEIDVVALLASADIAKGAKLVKKKCALCHNVIAAKGNGTGPNLFGVAGRDKATVAGFAYSEALLAKGGQWDEKSLFSFLTKPKNFVPGTKMTFAGFKKEADKVNVIAYLKTLK